MLNKVMLIGRLGADPEVRYTTSGSAVTTLNMATSRPWKDKQTGEKKESTEWHRVVFFERLAEVAGEYLKKGSLIYVEGRLQTRKWQGQDGHDRYTTEIVASQMQMLGSRSGGTTAFDDNATQTPPLQTSAPRPPVSANTPPPLPPMPPAPPSYEDFDDDIPF